MAVPYYGDFPINHTSVVIPFNAFTSNDPSASATITDFAGTDVHIHKNGSLTQRASSAGVAIDIDVDTITGGHWITIDLSNNTDAGFYAAGSEISVRIEGVTIDGATINAFIGAFSIERAGGILALLKAGTVDVNTKTITNGIIIGDTLAASACTKIIDDFETQSQADPTGFHVNVKEVNGTAQTANDNGADINDILVDTGTTLDALIKDVQTDTKYIFDVSATGDADAPIADSIAESLRQMRWFVANLWDIDETATPDTLTIFKDDTITTGMSFQVYTSASHNYRIPI